jgi:hypothetical protein
VRSFIQSARRWGTTLFATTGVEKRADPLTAHYDKLERLYLNNGPYDDLANVNRESGYNVEGLVGLRSLRNPANRVTEFYAAKLDPYSWLETVEYGDKATQGDNITLALRSVHRWSNWEREGRTSARQFSWAGDLFLKVATRHAENGDAVAVYKERLDPRNVKDFDTDERGILTYLRVSTPKTRRVDDELEAYTQTEIWDKEMRSYRVFEHKEGEDPEQLSEPILTQSLSADGIGAPDGATGFDFIPVVHARFRDIGEPRGLSCFGHALGLIRECDRIATKLHEMLFPDVTWVLQRSGVGPDGNPLPPIELEDERGTNPLDLPDGKLWARGYDRTTYASKDAISVGRDRVVRLPAGGALEPKIPNRNFAPALEALAEQVKALEAELPETAYSKLRDLELSGRAIRYVLDDVYSRFGEAFTNLAQAVIRLEDMALSIGQAVGLDGFSVAEIGEYGETGEAFARTYPTPDPFPSSRLDDAEADLAEATALAAYKALGSEPYRRALEAAGWTKEEARAEAQSAGATPQTSIQGVTNLIEQVANGGADQSNAARRFAEDGPLQDVTGR